MSRRTGFLGVAVLVCGAASWWYSPSPIRGGEDEAQPAQAAPAKPQPKPAELATPKPHRAKWDFGGKPASKAEEKIQAALNDPQGVDIEFIDTPLKDAVDFLADAHDITILIDEQALTEAKVAIDEPINRTLSGITLKNAMNVMFEPLDLTYLIEDDVLKITTNAAMAKKRVLRVYNVEHLQEMGVETKALSETLKKILTPPQGQPTRTERHPEKQWLILRNEEGIVAIRNQTTGQAIFDYDSSNATIEVLGGFLVVSAPRPAHEKIQDVLTQLDRGW